MPVTAADETQEKTPSGTEGAAGDPNFMTSLARGLAVIRAFSEAGASLTSAEVAKITGLPRAATRRCLLTLVQLGYAGNDGHSFYLKPKVLSLGYSFLSSASLAAILSPLLEQVSARLQESSSAAVLDDDQILYIARAATRRIMSIGLNVGSRLPAYCTSMGRVLLAHLPAAERDAYLARAELKRFTAHTIADRAALARELDAVRAQGYALIDQELELGLRSIAVPVVNRAGAVVAALNASAQAARATPDQIRDTFLPVLREAAGEARFQLPR